MTLQLKRKILNSLSKRELRMKIYTVTQTFKVDSCVEPWKKSYTTFEAARKAITKSVKENWDELKLFWMLPGLAIASAEGDEPSIEYLIQETELQE